MNAMTHRGLFAAVLAIVSASASASLHHYPVVIVNDPAPGVTAGATFNNIGPIMMGEGGKFIFSAPGVSGNGIGNSGIWSGTLSNPLSVPPTGVAPVVVRNDPAPGISGGNFGPISNTIAPVLSANGNVAFQHNLPIGSPASVTASNNTGIWAKTSTSFTLVAREGDAAPGAGGATFASDTGFAGAMPDAFANDGPVINSTGHVAVAGHLSDDTYGIWSTSPGSLTLVARTKDAAPGTGKFFNTIGRNFFGPRLADNGKVAFGSSLSASPTDPPNPDNSDRAIWAGTPGSLTLVARMGDPAPGFTGTYSSLNQGVAMNRSGKVAYVGESGGVVGAWAGDPSSPTLVLKGGTPAVGISGSTFGGSVNGPTIGDGGHLAVNINFGGALTGRGFWVGTSTADLSLVAYEGQQAPGAAAGVNFLTLANNALVDGFGNVAFLSSLTGSGVITSGPGKNDSGLWLFNFATAQTQLVLRLGDIVEAAPSDFRTVSAFITHNGAGLQTGNGTALAADGYLAHMLLFTDGSFGLFAIPEPGAIGLLAIGALALRRRPANIR